MTKTHVAMPVALVLLPYHYGRHAPEPLIPMALGPRAILASSALLSGLKDLGVVPAVTEISGVDDPSASESAGQSGVDVEGLFPGDQMSRMFVQNVALGREVRKARGRGSFVLALNGACTAALGMVAGVSEPSGEVGMIWLDAHDDAMTPNESVSGLLEGMPVAMIAGRCWQAYCARMEGFHPIPEDRILTIGLHERYESRVPRSGLPGSRVSPSEIAALGFEAAIDQALQSLARRCSRVYVHFDVDVLDPSVARVSRYMAEGGLTMDQLVHLFGRIADLFKVEAMDVASFDPSIQPEAAETIGQAIVAAVKAFCGPNAAR